MVPPEHTNSNSTSALVDSSALDALVRGTEPLPVLFCHSCRDVRAHALFAELQPLFLQHGLALQCDPFTVGEDVYVAMSRLQVRALVFFCTPLSTGSEPCRIERAAALRRGATVAVIRTTDATLPEELARRIACILDDQTTKRCLLPSNNWWKDSGSVPAST